MARASENVFPKVQFSEETAPGTPSTDQAVIYVKSDGKLYLKDDTGSETDLTSGGGGGTSIAIDSDAVSTSEGTTNTSYTDLTTSGPAATVDVPASGVVLVHVAAQMSQSSGTSHAIASFAVSGANTIAASANEYISNKGSSDVSAGRTIILTGLSTGSTTFTMKYRVSGSGTATFLNRTIIVETRP